MEYRPLGRTGVQVSKLCLGTMMFGAWGNTDHDDSVRIIHRALDAGVNFVDTADVYSDGESEEIVGKALAGARRDDVVLATKFWGSHGRQARTAAARRGAGSSRRSSTRCDGSERTGSTSTSCTAPCPARTSTRPSGRSPTSSSRARFATSARPRSPEARSSRRSGWRASGTSSASAPSSRPYSLLVRGIEVDVLPVAQRHGMGILTYSPLAGGWLSGRWSADATPTSPARKRLAARFDMSLAENQRKLEAVQALGEVAEDAGLSLIELAIAFVVNHPAVTSAIIGPRTMEQLDSQLPAADVTLSAGAARPHRRDRPSRRQPQRRRHQLRRPGAHAGDAAALAGSIGGSDMELQVKGGRRSISVREPNSVLARTGRTAGCERESPRSSATTRYPAPATRCELVRAAAIGDVA